MMRINYDIKNIDKEKCQKFCWRSFKYFIIFILLIMLIQLVIVFLQGIFLEQNPISYTWCKFENMKISLFFPGYIGTDEISKNSCLVLI
jgi:hypothetical protein